MIGNEAPTQRSISGLADIVRIAARAATGDPWMPEWCESMTCSEDYFTDQPARGICVCPARRSVPEELVTVELNLPQQPTLALNARILLREAIEPSIPGVGKVRVDFTHDGIAVLHVI